MPIDFSSINLDDVQFPSAKEYEARSGSGDWPEHTKVEDGMYQFEVKMLTPEMEDQYSRDDDAKPIRFMFLTVVDSDDPEDLGKVVRKKLKVTGHPNGAAYPFLTGAYQIITGQPLPANKGTSFDWIQPGMQFTAFLNTKQYNGNDYQEWVAVKPVAPENNKAPF